MGPDIAAPGVNIVAAVPSLDPNDSGYEFMSGTSMACPHVAGIVALLKSLHPDWSPAAMKSAIVTTASSTDESGGSIFAYGLSLKIADPFDFGGGIVNPNKAANPGLIYDMGMEDYVHYLCSRGYPDSDISRVTAKSTVCPSKRPSVLDMNLPSIAIPSLKSSVTISRTLTNVGPVKSVYKASIQLPPGIHAALSPSVLEFNSKAKKLSFTVTFSSAQKVQGGYYFGSLTWSDGVHNVRSPIAVRPEIIPCSFSILTLNMCSSLNPENHTLTGKVVLCFDKLVNQHADDAVKGVKAAGGVGLIFARNPGQPIASCEDFPCVEVDFEIGKQLHFYIRSSRSPMVKISPSKTKIGKPLSAKVAYFSSRGPNSVDPYLLKPDIAAPGVNIVAAVPGLDPNVSGYEFMSGTSMACPHVAGIVALLKSLHPDWSPAAMKSAIVTTASSTDESGGSIFAYGLSLKIADPFDFGGGIVNPNKAADPGLIYDMGVEDYVHYLCSRGYPDSDISRVTTKSTVCPSKRPSVLDMNLPSIAIPSLKSSVTISRTLTNVGPVKSVYKSSIQLPPGIHAAVSPSVLEFNSKAKKLSFTITFSSTQKVQGGYYFGSLTWSDGFHNVRSPITVRPEIISFYTDNA
ncbi:hypothetical protein ACLOJK_030383 [Asimina triloba]